MYDKKEHKKYTQKNCFSLFFLSNPFKCFQWAVPGCPFLCQQESLVQENTKKNLCKFYEEQDVS